jgi:hypothetical protein
MIIRTHQKGDAASRAVYSPCMAFRYDLERVWNASGPRILFVGLNPSTATELENDPTVERCERRARAMGFGAFRMGNIFALRATDPKVMRAHPAPEGAGNDDALGASARWADVIVAAWGAHGTHRGRSRTARAILEASGRPLMHLGLTAGGEPRHPLYLSYAVIPAAWDRAPVTP